MSEDLIRGTAQLIVDYGLKDLGYEYVILDDCWSAGRNASANNSLIADPEKFPSGMAAVADAMHDLGLKYGMYSSAGEYTCGGYAGSLGYETIDAQTWADWGVDYLKYDNCYNRGQAGTQLISYTRYETMGKALNATGRPILYSLCNWGEDYPWNWGYTIANSWRITGDVFDAFDKHDIRCPCDGDTAYDCALPGFHCSYMNIANKASFVASKCKSGGWNDLDMLEVGNGASTDAEYVAHFSLWAAAKSPLIMGNDLRVVAPKDLSILSNAAVIAINQDPKGDAAIRRWIFNTNDTDASGIATIQMWSGPLTSTTGGDYNDEVVILVNGGATTRAMNATLADIFTDDGLAGTAAEIQLSWEVRDLWANRMSTEEAQAIIDASSAVGNATNGYNATRLGEGPGPNGTTTGRYNATALSYKDGLAKLDPLLLGNLTGTIAPSGTLTADVEPHGVKMYRLRAVPTAVTKRDEL